MVAEFNEDLAIELHGDCYNLHFPTLLHPTSRTRVELGLSPDRGVDRDRG
jgi:hypothetical protein